MEQHFDTVTMAFSPQYNWIEGTFEDPSALVSALKAQDGLEDFEDERGNAQSAVRLDYDPEVGGGIWAILPAGTKAETVQAAVAAYPDHVEQIAKEIQQQVDDSDNVVISAVIDALSALPDDKPITKADLVAALRGGK